MKKDVIISVRILFLFSVIVALIALQMINAAVFNNNLDNGLVAYYSFDTSDGSTSTFVKDLVGTNNGDVKCFSSCPAVSQVSSPIKGQAYLFSIPSPFLIPTNFTQNFAQIMNGIDFGDSSVFNFGSEDFSISFWTYDIGPISLGKFSNPVYYFFISQGRYSTHVVGGCDANWQTTDFSKIATCLSVLDAAYLSGTTGILEVAGQSLLNLSNKANNNIFVKSGDNITLYVNGKIRQVYTILNNTLGSVDNPGNFYVFPAQESMAYPQATSAMIDELGIWNRALTEDEAFNIYNNTNSSQAQIPACTSDCPMQGRIELNCSNNSVMERMCINSEDSCNYWTNWTLNQTCLNTQTCNQGQCNLTFQYCSDYKTQDQCTNDSFALAEASAPSSFSCDETCPNINGCSCQWINNTCSITTSSTPNTNCGGTFDSSGTPGSPGEVFGTTSCSYGPSVVENNCNNTQNNIIVRMPSLNPSKCSNAMNVYQCPLAAKLPLFTNFEIVITLLIIAVIYLFLNPFIKKKIKEFEQSK